LGYGISNNQAEYQGLIDGLDYIYENNIGCYKIFIWGDSLIVINQMDGSYNVNSPNIIPYYNQAQNSLGSINADWYFFRHIPRHSNWEADSLANQAIDG
jgi:ribonuclease HI